MNELKEIDEGAYNWLQHHSTIIWSRNMFRGDAVSEYNIEQYVWEFQQQDLEI